MGLDLAALDTRIVVKLPITDAGVEAAGLLRSQGVRITLTGGGSFLHAVSLCVIQCVDTCILPTW